MQTHIDQSVSIMGLLDGLPSSNTSSSSWKRIAFSGGIFAVLFTSAILIAVSLKKIKSTEYGLEYDIYTKQLDDAAKVGGLHAGPPGFEFIKFPSTYITVDLPDGSCLSQDGLRVQFSVTFQYQMPKEWIVPAVLKYRDYENWQKVVAAAGNSAVQHTCSEFNISNFQNKRGIIQNRMEENLRLKLEGGEESGDDGVYALAISLQLRNVDLPEEYRNAVEEKQSAEEDIALAKNQRTQETTKAMTALLTAKEEARKISNTAVNDAAVTLTEARLKAEETQFAFETEAGVIVRVKESLNLTTEGVLAYMTNTLLSEVPNLKVSAEEPARLSRKDEL